MTPTKKRTKKPSLIFSFNTIAAVFLLVLLIKNPQIASTAVIHSLQICASLLIPSLFPLMAASEIAVESGAICSITRPFSGIVSKLLGIKKDAAVPIFLGLIGGYTTSVSGALSLFRSGRISKQDCERVIGLSSLPSLSFLTGFVGMGIFKKSTIGWALWGVSIASGLIVGLMTRKFSKAAPLNHKEPKYPQEQNDCLSRKKCTLSSPSNIIVGAISHSAYSMLLICACVVFFSALIATLYYPLEALGVPSKAQIFILGSLEITNGIVSCVQIAPDSLRLIVCAFFIGWSGLCVHFQIIGLCEGYGLSFKRYFIYKLLQGLICVLLVLIIFNSWHFKF